MAVMRGRAVELDLRVRHRSTEAVVPSGDHAILVQRTTYFSAPQNRTFHARIDGLLAEGNDSKLFDLIEELPDLVSKLRDATEDRFDVPIPAINIYALTAIVCDATSRASPAAAIPALPTTYRLSTEDNDDGPEPS